MTTVSICIIPKIENLLFKNVEVMGWRNLQALNDEPNSSSGGSCANSMPMLSDFVVFA